MSSNIFGINKRARDIPLVERLRLGYDVCSDTGCWLWRGYKTSGYGRIRSKGRRVAAHRAMYEAMVGPIPEGMTIDHLCSNRACVNPHHLEPVSNRENGLRSQHGPQAINHRKTHCNRGHEYTPANTLILFRGEMPTRLCKECYGWRRPSAMTLEEILEVNPEFGFR